MEGGWKALWEVDGKTMEKPMESGWERLWKVNGKPTESRWKAAPQHLETHMDTLVDGKTIEKPMDDALVLC